MEKISEAYKRASWEFIILGLLVLLLFVLIAIFSTERKQEDPYPTRIAIPPNLECFQVIGEVDNKDPGYNAIQIYWCRDRNDKNACYWYRPGLEPIKTRCNKTIFREMN